MDALTENRLVELNRSFYSEHAAEFSATRQRPWPGWDRVLDRWSGVGRAAERSTILDLGCGNGRFAGSCALRLPPAAWRYVGVDASGELLADARARLDRLDAASYTLHRGDLLDGEDGIWSLARADLVVLFGVLHHVPGAAARRGLLRRAARRVAPAGMLAVSFWQIAELPRLAARTLSASDVGLEATTLETGDLLLRWGDGEAVRYCHDCPPDEAAALVRQTGLATGLEPLDSFRADGENGRTNLYWLLAAAG